MKNLLLSLIACIVISLTVHSQSMEGIYTNTWESAAGGALTYTIILNPDNTFQFVSHREYETTNPSKTTTVVGTWDNRNRLLILSTDTSSGEIQLVKWLNNNKAKFKSFSPRHVKYNEEKSSLKFYTSKVFYAKGMELIKSDAKKDTLATSSLDLSVF